MECDALEWNAGWCAHTSR